MSIYLFTAACTAWLHVSSEEAFECPTKFAGHLKTILVLASLLDEKTLSTYIWQAFLWWKGLYKFSAHVPSTLIQRAFNLFTHALVHDEASKHLVVRRGTVSIVVLYQCECQHDRTVLLVVSFSLIAVAYNDWNNLMKCSNLYCHQMQTHFTSKTVADLSSTIRLKSH